MLELHHKRRWVLTPIKEDGSPLVDEYAIRHVLHLPHGGKGLAYCEFNIQGLAAARACPELHVFPSIHSAEAINQAVAVHYAGHGLKDGMSHHDALMVLAKHHGSFEPPE